ncbi:hypothetical protein CLOSCI_03822 [[Clostridium] scindens ATCC 35704]|nr:hypothetical protein CLOSCI_03822 [[Clostridium] scindens ATCC 35704]
MRPKCDLLFKKDVSTSFLDDTTSIYQCQVRCFMHLRIEH